MRRLERTFLLPGALALALAACGGGNTQKTSGAALPPPTTPTMDQPVAAQPAAPATPTPEEAKAFVAKLDVDLRKLWVDQQHADWAKQTNITPETEAASAKAGEAVMTYLTGAIRKAATFLPIFDKLDPDTQRKLTLLRVAGSAAPDDPAKAAEFAKITAGMDAAYGKGKVCDKDGKNCKDLGALEDIMAKSRKPDELLAAWRGWHDTVGKEIRPMYERFVELGNEGARGIGFKDMGEQWRAGYDMSPADFEKETDRLWGQVAPLYKELHCYARRQLNKKYGNALVPLDKPIPAHLVGNMWAQDWGYIYPELEPYKGQPQLDASPALVKQKYDSRKMAKMAESFFVSLGLDPLPPTFWERSMFDKPKDKEVVCHASAWDPEFNNDLRIKMCIKPNQEDLITLHHEIGHDYYFHSYYTLPVLYQQGANDGFHEAIGDTIALSVTPAYLKQVGLLTNVAKNDKAMIDAQMQRALDKVAFLPWGLLVDKWRWDVFAGKVPKNEYNKHWWDLRRQYQGIAPPMERSDEFFDPGAKYHVPGNTPYMRYFLAVILQFQFHRALCKAAGFTGPLHECSIFGNKAAGAKLKAMLEMGASKPWPDALEAITGQRDMDASAILEYFAPLYKWLQEQNKGQQCGW
jgi:peptidyl-dipeptidase A